MSDNAKLTAVRILRVKALKDFLLSRCYFGNNHWVQSSRLFQLFSCERASCIGLDYIINRKEFKLLMDEIEKDDTLHIKRHRLTQGYCYIGISLSYNNVLPQGIRKMTSPSPSSNETVKRRSSPRSRDRLKMDVNFLKQVEEIVCEEFNIDKKEFQGLRSHGVINRKKDSIGEIDIPASIRATRDATAKFLEKISDLKKEQEAIKREERQGILVPINEGVRQDLLPAVRLSDKRNHLKIVSERIIGLKI